jgi:hypothetical protein
MRRSLVTAALAILLVAGLTTAGAAHEIPKSVTVHAFVKPETDRLRVIVRVPLTAMRDMQWPETADGFLDVERADPLLIDAATQWILPAVQIREGTTLLPTPTLASTRVSLPSDRSFSSYDAALSHVLAKPPAGETRLPWQQALLDVLLEYPVTSAGSRFSIRPGFERLGVEVLTVLRFVPVPGAGGVPAVRAFEFRGDPGFVQLDPRWHQSALRFVSFGFLHILDGVDHLLFLFCLVIPFRRLKSLILIVTAFTAAHSISLAAAVSGFAPDGLWFSALIELLIAASIFYVAIENIVGSAAVSRRWVLAFAFGLVHGFGFSFALQDALQFAGAHLVTSLLAFNVGVELGQILVLLMLLPVLHVLFTRVVLERMGTIVLSVLVAHVAWHWMADRAPAVRPAMQTVIEGSSMLLLVRFSLIAVSVVALLWLARRGYPMVRSRTRSDRRASTGAAAPALRPEK